MLNIRFVPRLLESSMLLGHDEQQANVGCDVTINRTKPIRVLVFVKVASVVSSLMLFRLINGL